MATITSMSSVFSKDLYVVINNQKIGIFFLDNLESLKARIATLRYPSLIPEATVQLLPELIVLEPIEEKIEEVQASGCSEVQTVFPVLQGRQFILLDFFSYSLDGMKKVIKGQLKLDDLVSQTISIFHLNNLEEYATFIRTLILSSRNIDGNVKMRYEQFIKENKQLGTSFSLVYEYEAKKVLDKLQENSDRVRENEEDFKKFDRISSLVISSSVEITKTRLIVKFFTEKDVYELFNIISLSAFIPFITINPLVNSQILLSRTQKGSFYKVLKTFKPPIVWIKEIDEENEEGRTSDQLILYVLNKRVESEFIGDDADPRNYSRVIISKISQQESTPNMQMEIESRLDDQLKEENLLDRIIKGLAIEELKLCTFEQKRIDAEYITPLTSSFGIPFFYDLSMNDPLISQALVIDESIRTFRQRGGISTYFRRNKYTKQDDFIRFHLTFPLITMELASRLQGLKVGDICCLVKIIKAPNKYAIQDMQKAINKILQYFYSHRDEIKKEYINYLGSEIDALLEDVEPKRLIKPDAKGEELISVAPELFARGYARRCEYSPRILQTQEEIERSKKEGWDTAGYTMRFPQYREWEPERIYSCAHHSSHPYAGLKINTLSNKQFHPYIPCCYQKDQSKNPNRPRYQYEHREEERNEETGPKKERKTKLFITNKVLRPGIEGLLPPLIDRFLRSLYDSNFPEYAHDPSYVRRGTLQDKNSVLDAIFRAIIQIREDIALQPPGGEQVRKQKGKEALEKYAESQAKNYATFIASRLKGNVLADIFRYLDINKKDEDRRKMLGRVRHALVDWLDSNVTIQSTFAFEIQTLKDMLLDDNSYLDVKYIWRVLEEVFDINIFLFRRSHKNLDGELTAPVFSQGYLQYKSANIRGKDYPAFKYTIILFETIGAEFDKLDYPQVELVQKMIHITDQEIIPISYFVEYNDAVFLNKLRKVFNEMYSINSKPNHPVVNVFTQKPSRQCADYYGKIRFLQFEKLCILTEPLPAFDKIDLVFTPGECKFGPVSRDMAIDFLTIEKANFSPLIINNSIIGFQCVKQISEINLQQGAKTHINFYIPIIPYASSAEMKIEIANIPSPTFTENQRSFLTHFNDLERLARYVSEYVIWIFSHWNKAQKNPQLKDRKYLERFALEKFLIKRDHHYSKIPRLFQINLPNLIQDGKIIVPDTNTRNRLIYILDIKLKRNQEEVVEYYKQSYISNYYQYITDFQLQSQFVILLGKEMLFHWILTRPVQYTLNRKIIHPEDIEDKDELEDNLQIEPYFIHLDKLPNSIYLVQQAQTVPKALAICQQWKERHINIGRNSQEEIEPNSVEFVYIIYRSSDDYDIHTFQNKPLKKDDYCILEYKNRGRIYTMSLLPWN